MAWIAKFPFHFAAPRHPLRRLPLATLRIIGVFSALRWALWKSRWSLVGRNGAAKVPRMQRLAALYTLRLLSRLVPRYFLYGGKNLSTERKDGAIGEGNAFHFSWGVLKVVPVEEHSREVPIDELWIFTSNSTLLQCVPRSGNSKQLILLIPDSSIALEF